MKKEFLTRRRHGIWYVVTTLEDGRRVHRSTGTRDRDEAEKFLTQREEPRSPALTLSRFAREILAYTGATFAHATMQLYRDSLRALQRHVGDIPIELISVRDVDRYKAARVKSVKPITVNKELSTLKAAFNQAARWGYVTVNPFAQTKKLRVPEQPPAYFTRDEVLRLIDAMVGFWLRDLVIMGVNTGMRVGEMTNLRWEHVDLARRVVRVASENGFSTKTGRTLIVPLNAHTASLLADRRERGEQYVFTMRGRQIKKNWVSSAFKKYIRRLGLREELHFHSLRHTFASWLVQDGVSLYQVSRLLGHTDVKTTQVYGHLAPEQMHDIVERLTI